jgi:enoyl-CoA hydratase
MAEFNNLQINLDNGILTITIDRESKLNALNIETMDEIRLAMERVYDDKEVLACIITGAGTKAFVAGADIQEISDLNEMNGRKFAENGQEIFQAIEDCPKPVIAAVNGFALGGGCELAMSCHMRIASANAKFGQPEVNLGIVPGYGGTQRLTQLIGKGKALELLMTGDMVNAEEARQLGLVNHVVSTNDELIPRCTEIIDKIKAKAPIAISMIIDSVRSHYHKEENGFQTEANAFSICCKTEDFKEGTAAFLEKREANFSGN